MLRPRDEPYFSGSLQTVFPVGFWGPGTQTVRALIAPDFVAAGTVVYPASESHFGGGGVAGYAPDPSQRGPAAPTIPPGGPGIYFLAAGELLCLRSATKQIRSPESGIFSTNASGWTTYLLCREGRY